MDDKVHSKAVTRETTSEGYQRVAGASGGKNMNLKQNFVLGKEHTDYKTVSQGYHKWIQPMPDK